MSPFHLSVPVVFIIFNRPETTGRVFEEIRVARPPKLFVVADSSRPDRPGEEERCRKARKVVEDLDWRCEVLKNYSDSHLGCRRRVSTGLDWVFGMADKAIILEDDCLPHPTFFRFCEELLDRYQDDGRVAMISGNNLQFGRKRTSYSYYFSRYAHIWGWASWSRAWKDYDATLAHWLEIRDGGWLEDCLGNERSAKYWRQIFDRVRQNKVDSWGYVWMFSCWIQNRLTVLPNVNLVSNIGFGPRATHTSNDENKLSCLKSEAMEFPLVHPPFLILDSVADALTEKEHFSFPTRFQRSYRLLRHVLGKFLRRAAKFS